MRHPEADQPSGGAPCDAGIGTGGRLNLLLSSGGWQPEPWVNRLPRILEPIGVRSHVAGSARLAQRVIEAEPIHIAVVDLALPLGDSAPEPGDEEAGVRVLELLARMAVPPPTVVIKRRRSARDDQREMHAALRSGAFAVVDRPREQNELEALLEVLRRCLARHYRGRWPGGQTA